MTNKVIFFLSFVLLLSTAYAQDGNISIGAKGGLNVASITNLGGTGSASIGSNSVTNKKSPVLGAHVGVYGQFKITDAFFIQPEIMFSMKGSKYNTMSKSGSNSSEYDSKTTLSYIDIPVQARFNFGNFHILGGPYLAFLVGAKSKSTSEVINGSTKVTTENEETDRDVMGLKSTDFGLYLGAGYETEGGLSFGLRWCKGFSDISEAVNAGIITSNPVNTNSVFQLSVGYRFASF